MLQPGRNFNSSDYRFGFGGYEKDDEIKGSGNHYSFSDYGYDPRLIRRWQVDPLSFKYAHQSPYAVFNNNPIIFVDPDGREAILFVDVAGVGHVFIAVMDENDVFTIYTYGQYGQGNEGGESSATGKGALIRLKGQNALDYLERSYSNTDKYDIRAFYLSDAKVDEEGVIKYFDKIIDDPNATPAENVNDVEFVKGEGSKAVQYKYYTGVPVPAITENCVTCADEGLEAGGSDIIGTEYWPARLNVKLKVKDYFSKNVKQVTSDVKKDVQGGRNINVGDYEPKKK